MDEIWKDIKGYEGIYQVSNIGRVRSLDRWTEGNKCMFKRGRIIKPFDNKGYNNTSLSRGGVDTTFATHRLVADAFIPNPDNLPCVNHKDGHKRNNVVDNLEWVTYSENTRHAIGLGLIDAEASKEYGKQSVKVVGHPLICRDSGEVFECKQDAARRLHSGFMISTIGRRSHEGKGLLFEEISREEYLNLRSHQKSYDEYDKIYHDVLSRCKHKGIAVPIYCIERKTQYPSVSAAARDNKMDNETIRLSIMEHRKAKGLTFIRTDGGEF